MKTRETTPGKTYSVHTMNGCTIIEPDGWQKTIEAPDGYFDAHFGSVVIEGDDEASIKQLFKLAPQQRLAILGVLGGNSGGLPAGYKRVEWLASPYMDAIWIRTYWPFYEDSIFELDLRYEKKSFGWIRHLGTAWDGKFKSIAFGIEPNDRINVNTAGNNPNQFFSPIPITDDFRYLIQEKSTEICLNNAACYQYGYTVKEKTGGGLGFTANFNVYIYRISQKDGDALKHTLVPCVDETGAPCLFDLVTRESYYSAGKGDFIYPSEATTYALRRVLPDWGKLTEYGLRRLYHAPAGYQGELYDFALENGYKPIVETEQPAEGYWAPRWTETADKIVLEWVETEPPMDEFGPPEEDLTNN